MTSQVAQNPRVGVLLLNWNGAQDTLDCLDSLKKSSYHNVELLVVDNGSTDYSVEKIRKVHPDVTLIMNEKNLGFAEGNNVGMRYFLDKGVDVVFLLNNDTVVDEHCLSAFVEAHQQREGKAVLGAKIYYYDDKERIWNFGALWNCERLSLEVQARNDEDKGWDEDFQVDHIIGCAMWIPRAILEKVGLFEPRFFLNYEETDWCFRARRLGFTLVSVAKARLWHKISASFVSKPHNGYFLFRNRLLFVKRNFFGKERALVYLKHDLPQLLKMVFKLTFKLLFYPLDYCFTRRREKTRARIRYLSAALLGTFHYFIGRFGNCPPYLLKKAPPQ